MTEVKRFWCHSSIEIGGAAQGIKSFASVLKNEGHIVDIELGKNHSFKYKYFSKIRTLLNTFLNKFFARLQLPKKNSLFSSALVSVIDVKKINKSDYDFIVIGWVAETMSINDISKINKPIIWRFSDFWPLLGGYHYLTQKKDKLKIGFDFDKLLKKLKYKMFSEKNFVIICPSRMMREAVNKSEVFRNSKAIFMPTSVDEEFFNFHDTRKSNSKFKILFGASNALSDKRKGLNFIIKALKKLDSEKFELTIFGDNFKGMIVKDGIKINSIGKIGSRHKLSEIYNENDYLVVSSVEDNFPQIPLEALFCGTPCIIFNNPGLIDLKIHEAVLVSKNLSIDDLAQKIFIAMNSFNNLNSKEIAETSRKNFGRKKSSERIKAIMSSFNNL